MSESANGNACNRCQHRWNEPDLDDGHCYMFASEPRVCFQYKPNPAVSSQSDAATEGK